MGPWNETTTLVGGGVGQCSTPLSPYPRLHWADSGNELGYFLIEDKPVGRERFLTVY